MHSRIHYIIVSNKNKKFKNNTIAYFVKKSLIQNKTLNILILNACKDFKIPVFFKKTEILILNMTIKFRPFLMLLMILMGLKIKIYFIGLNNMTME